MEKSNGELPPQFVHDLVNELAVISSHCDLLNEHLETGSQSSKRVDAIKAVAHHIARQLHESLPTNSRNVTLLSPSPLTV